MLRLLIVAIVAGLVLESNQMILKATEDPEPTEGDTLMMLMKATEEPEPTKEDTLRILMPVEPGCWTKWYNQDDPSGAGDWELLRKLRREYPGEICKSPLYIEAATAFTGVPAIFTGQHFHVYNPSKGFVCRNRDQRDRRCLDYKVRFGCPCQY